MLKSSKTLQLEKPLTIDQSKAPQATKIDPEKLFEISVPSTCRNPVMPSILKQKNFNALKLGAKMHNIELNNGSLTPKLSEYTGLYVNNS